MNLYTPVTSLNTTMVMPSMYAKLCINEKIIHLNDVISVTWVRTKISHRLLWQVMH